MLAIVLQFCIDIFRYFLAQLRPLIKLSPEHGDEVVVTCAGLRPRRLGGWLRQWRRYSEPEPDEQRQRFDPNFDIAFEPSQTPILLIDAFDASEDGTGRGTPIVPIAFSCKDHSADAGEIAPTLRAMGHHGSHTNAGGRLAVAFDWQNSAGGPNSTETFMTLCGDRSPAVSVALRGRDGGATAELGSDISNAIRASTGGGDKAHVLTHAVRRLTPQECERLQGFPGSYARIPVRHYAVRRITRLRPVDMWEPSPDGGLNLMAADGPRHKALGNSMAVPVMRRIGERIAIMEAVIGGTSAPAFNTTTPET